MISIIKSETQYFIDLTNTQNNIVVCLDKSYIGHPSECKYIVINEFNETIAKFVDYKRAIEYANKLLNESENH